MTDTTPGPERPAKNASADTWRTYAADAGLQLDPERTGWEDYSRDELVKLADEADAEAEREQDQAYYEAKHGQQIAGPNTMNPTGDKSFDTVDRSHPGADPETGQLARQPLTDEQLADDHPRDDDVQDDDEDEVDDLEAEQLEGDETGELDESGFYDTTTEATPATVTWDDSNDAALDGDDDEL